MMRWDALFADLEQQWSAQDRRELDAEVADRTRAERAAIGLAARLAAAGPQPVHIGLGSGLHLSGQVVDVGEGWVLVAAAGGVRSGTPSLVPFAAITSVAGLGRGSTPRGQLRRFGLAYALRGLSRNRAVVSLVDLGGGVVVGTIDAVGADVLELAEHPADVARRPENITGRRLVPFAALALIRPV